MSGATKDVNYEKNELPCIDPKGGKSRALREYFSTAAKEEAENEGEYGEEESDEGDEEVYEDIEETAMFEKRLRADFLLPPEHRQLEDHLRR